MFKSVRPALREKLLLLAYAASVIVVLTAYTLLGVLRHGLPVTHVPTGQVELAVLLPLSGPQARLGQTVLRIVQRASRVYPPHLNPQGTLVTIVGYDTLGTPEGAAEAALRALLDPATAVVIGPLDTRQVVAAAQVLEDERLALITPASTAPVLPLERYPGLYRIPAPDDIQGRAMVDWVNKLNRCQVLMIAGQSAYAQEIKAVFDQAARGQLQTVQSLDASQIPLLTDLAYGQTSAVIYLGEPQAASLLWNAIEVAGLDLPFIGSDTLAELAVLEEESPIYYTSPILNLPAALDQPGTRLYRQTLGALSDGPYAYETVQATWFALSALARRAQDESARQAVWRNLTQVSIPGYGEQTSVLQAGQRQPMTIYVYQLAPHGAAHLVHLVEEASHE